MRSEEYRLLLMGPEAVSIAGKSEVPTGLQASEAKICCVLAEVKMCQP
jgi:hypothetical protein